MAYLIPGGSLDFSTINVSSEIGIDLVRACSDAWDCLGA